MCLAAIAFHAHPRYPLVLAANRDEFHARPTAPAAWWPERWFAGRDLSAGGTWLGVRSDGRFAFLTNVREPLRHDPSAPSRGALVAGALASVQPPLVTIRALLRGAAAYNGFNLVCGTVNEVAWGSNRDGAGRPLPPGIHALSNALIDVPWPKVLRLRSALEHWCARGGEGFDTLWSALGDRRIANDDELPCTGVSLEWERMLSAPFIVSDRYGTRSSTIVAFDKAGVVHFTERSFAPDGRIIGEVDEELTKAATPRAAPASMDETDCR